MKKLLLLILFCPLFLLKLNANPPPFVELDVSEIDIPPKIYLGIGLGINNYSGILGIGCKIRVYETFFIRGGAGLSTWGWKTTGGIIYERKYTKGWGFGLGYSSCSGIKDFETELQVITQGGNLVDKKVLLDLQRASSVNLTASYNWVMRKQNKFFIEFGYAVPVETTPYKVKDDSNLSVASKAVLDMMRPGGLIFGLGIMFGL